MKKFITLIAAIIMIATMLTGCGVDAPADDIFNKYDTETSVSEDADKKETVDDKKDETSNDKDAEKDDTKSDTADKKEDANKSDSKPADKNDNASTSTPSAGNDNASKPVVPQEKPAEPTKPAHKHSYTSTVTANPTCTSAGTKTFTCSCGSRYTESIPATGHNFVAQYETKYETVYHKGNTIYKPYCNCGILFDTIEEWSAHNLQIKLTGQPGHGYCDIEETTEDWTEQIPKNINVGNKCTTCGTWQ